MVGWIGGGAMIATGIIAPIIWNATDEYFNETLCMGVVVAPLVVSGAAWCIGWNVAAHNLMKKARLAEMYSMAVIQTEEFKIGKSSIVGSLNVMGDTFTKTNTLGIGLTLNL